MKKDRILKEWVFLSDEDQDYFDGDPNNFSIMIYGVSFEISKNEVIDSIENYFGDFC